MDCRLLTRPSAVQEDRPCHAIKADQLGIPQIAAERFEDLLASGELPE